jgi:hypothetical protein
MLCALAVRTAHELAREHQNQRAAKTPARPAHSAHANAIKRENQLVTFEMHLPAPVRPLHIHALDIHNMTTLDLSPDMWPRPTLEGLVWLRSVPRLTSLTLNNLDLSWKTPVANAGPMPTAAGIRVRPNASPRPIKLLMKLPRESVPLDKLKKSRLLNCASVPYS